VIDMPTQTDIDRLVAAAAEAMSHGQGTDELGKALEPFRPKKPRTGTLIVMNNDPVFPEARTVINDGGIELTDEVKLRLSETAGVDKRVVVDTLLALNGLTEDVIANAIMALIAKGKVDYE
jgi:hypothetical protein